MNPQSFGVYDYLLLGLAIALTVSIAAATYAGVQLWRHRRTAKRDLHPSYRGSRQIH